jgi:hypothetical protein
MDSTLEERLGSLRRRLLSLCSQFRYADKVQEKSNIESELSDVLRAIAHLEAEIRLEQSQQESESPES